MINSNQKIYALLIESNQGYIRLIREMLVYSKDFSFELESVKTVADAVQRLMKGGVDIVLLDISSLENWDMQAIRPLRYHGSEIPIILLASKQDEAIVMNALRDNVQDYLVRGQMTSHLLVRSVQYSIERHRNLLALKNQAKKLYASESNFRSLIANNADGMIVFDKEGNVLFVNPAAKRIFGDEESILSAIRGKFPFSANEFSEIEISSGEGAAYFVEIRFADTEWQGKKALLATLRDITQRKRTEQMLQRRENDLSEQKKLLEWQAAELKTVNQELKDFASIISHDLKAPLRAIGSLANWIANDCGDKFDEAGKFNVNLLINRVKRMHDFIDGVLQYSRVGRVREEMVLINLNKTVKEIIDSLAPPAHIKISIANELPNIYFERTRITQVLQNLLSNAVKYMDKPRGHIKIGSFNENGNWKFYVSDNGPGIEEKYSQKIFQIFQTLNPRDEVESTGIGLTLVKKIVELYDGKIWLESIPGKGSTFFFQLPRNGKS